MMKKWLSLKNIPNSGYTIYDQNVREYIPPLRIFAHGFAIYLVCFLTSIRNLKAAYSVFVFDDLKSICFPTSCQLDSILRFESRAFFFTPLYMKMAARMLAHDAS